ncbi:hypothetical protein A3B64_01790 [candidate division WWE3 bacterium RIFCSPLOWO2_01_FULL_37_24]|nr:MAG: hypothetical protein A3B64_01790 [candidate division WWE3 bacterium RIFCSPLOWO2_01_FULL_37_24]HLB52000.1 signal peptidase II [Patescibacteria group bacterium]
MNDPFYNCSFLSANISPQGQVILILLFLALVLVFLRNKINFKNLKKKRIYIVPLVLIALGGSVNLFQRFFYGCVYDDLSFFGLFKYNIWDLLVVSGLLLVFIKYEWYIKG